MSAASPGTIAAAKRASFTAELAALHLQQNLPEEELRLKQQRQEEARLRLEQRKQQFQLHTEIANMEAEEQVYAVAEQGDHYFRQPFPVQTQDLLPSSPPTQKAYRLLQASSRFHKSQEDQKNFNQIQQ